MNRWQHSPMTAASRTRRQICERSISNTGERFMHFSGATAACRLKTWFRPFTSRRWPIALGKRFASPCATSLGLRSMFCGGITGAQHASGRDLSQWTRRPLTISPSPRAPGLQTLQKTPVLRSDSKTSWQPCPNPGGSHFCDLGETDALTARLPTSYT